MVIAHSRANLDCHLDQISHFRFYNSRGRGAERRATVMYGWILCPLVSQAQALYPDRQDLRKGRAYSYRYTEAQYTGKKNLCERVETLAKRRSVVGNCSREVSLQSVTFA